MGKIISFDEFKKSAQEVREDMHSPESEEHSDEQYYMFFQNLASIKHYVEEIMKYDPMDIDNLLKNGHDWASDHVATSKDDLGEVAEWIRNEMEGEGEGEESPSMMGVVQPEIEVEIEDEKDEEGENKGDEEGDSEEDRGGDDD